MSSISTIRPDTSETGLFSRLSRWLDAMPHPHLAIEFSPDRMAAARWKGTSVDDFTVETLPPAALAPSAVEPNIMNASAVKSAMANIVSGLRARDQDVAQHRQPAARQGPGRRADLAGSRRPRLRAAF